MLEVVTVNTDPVPEPVKTYSHYSALRATVLSSCKYPTYRPNFVDYFTPNLLWGRLREPVLPEHKIANDLARCEAPVLDMLWADTHSFDPGPLLSKSVQEDWVKVSALMTETHCTEEWRVFPAYAARRVRNLFCGTKRRNAMYPPGTSDKPPYYMGLVLRQAAEDITLLEKIKISDSYQLYSQQERLILDAFGLSTPSL
ncbi:hypothetical protein BU15DRAFT_65295 [Melanogaster broomeanus]|nr:hypothetical protein BU15DRAFT_65295 [Melanogaster broomeanus]